MGNCICHRRAASWADDDEWEPESPPQRPSKDGYIPDAEGGKEKASRTTEVKIKITKKQLEELLAMADVKGLPIGEVLAGLMSLRADDDRGHHWRPTLQSIPEVTE